MEQKKIPAAERADYEHALAGIDFPVAKFALIRAIHDRGGIDHEVLDMVERLPADEYNDLNSLMTALRNEYRGDGYEDAAIPV